MKYDFTVKSSKNKLIRIESFFKIFVKQSVFEIVDVHYEKIDAAKFERMHEIKTLNVNISLTSCYVIINDVNLNI